MAQPSQDELSPSEYLNELIAAFCGQAQNYLRTVKDVNELPPPQQAARSALETLRPRNHFDAHVGPFYDTTKVRLVLGGDARRWTA